MAIVHQAVREAQQADPLLEDSCATNSDSSSTVHSTPSTASRKRKRSGDHNRAPVGPTGTTSPETFISAVHEFVGRIVDHSKDVVKGGEDMMVSSGYMKSVIRTTGEEASGILGSWLALCRATTAKTIISLDSNLTRSWLAPFITIWQARAVGSNDMADFSQQCLEPLLALLDVVPGSTSAWDVQLEQLLAKNVVMPARNSTTESEATLFRQIVSKLVSERPKYGPILFAVAIRSLPSQGTRRRRPHDVAWLQLVFSTLKEAMNSSNRKETTRALKSMLQYAITHDLSLDTPVLCSITTQHALDGAEADWGLLATILRVDANVFLIATDSKDLLSELLTALTRSSLQSPIDVQASITNVAVLLLEEFSKARNLTGFVQHWFAQLVEAEKLQSTAEYENKCSVWQSQALQSQLDILMETNLTTQQIVEILDWLEARAVESPAAFCVLLDAVAGAVSREETIDAIGLRPTQSVYDHRKLLKKMATSYRWYQWRIVRHTIRCSTKSSIDSLWATSGEGLLKVVKIAVKGTNEDLATRETLEAFASLCAVLDAIRNEESIEANIRKVLGGFLVKLNAFIQDFMSTLSEGGEEDTEKWGVSVTSARRSVGRYAASYASCLLVHYPATLQ